MKPKVLFWDVETSFIKILTYQWSLYPGETRFPYDQVIQDWFIICAAWQWYGQKKVHSVSVLDDPRRFKKNHADDYHVVKTLSDVISEADMVIAHNGNKFDMKKLNARILLNELPPHSGPLQQDTLVNLRSVAKLTSNKLDDIGAMRGKSRKIENPKGLWEAATNGEEWAIKHMVKYNKKDIPPLVETYEWIRPFVKQKLNMNHFQPGDCCPACKSKAWIANGWRYTAAYKYQRYICKDCGHAWKGERIKDKTITFK